MTRRLLRSCSRQIFLQLCTGGDLFTYLTSRTDGKLRLVEGEAKYIMYQIFKGLVYLHDKMISHRGKQAFVLREFLSSNMQLIVDLKVIRFLLLCVVLSDKP